MAETCTITGSFLALNGAPIANGSYSVKLSEDSYIVSRGDRVTAGVVATGSLSSEGVLAGLALFSTDPSVMKTYSGNQPYYEFKVMNSLGITVWHSELQLPPQPLFLFDIADFTPPTSYCYDDPGVTFVLSA